MVIYHIVITHQQKSPTKQTKISCLFQLYGHLQLSFNALFFGSRLSPLRNDPIQFRKQKQTTSFDAPNPKSFLVNVSASYPLSHEKKRPYFPWSLFKRDPYTGKLQSPYGWVVESPRSPKQLGYIHCLVGDSLTCWVDQGKKVQTFFYLSILNAGFPSPKTSWKLSQPAW